MPNYISPVEIPLSPVINIYNGRPHKTPELHLMPPLKQCHPVNEAFCLPATPGEDIQQMVMP